MANSITITQTIGPAWDARYLHPNMTTAEFIYKAQCLQFDGSLDCKEIKFRERNVLAKAVKAFFTLWYHPEVDQPMLCPSRLGDIHTHLPTHAVQVSVFNDLISGTWGIRRTVGIASKARLQYYVLGNPDHINVWSDTPQVGNRDRVLGEFAKLCLSPYFCDIRPLAGQKGRP